jgi:hypothetical protein
MSDESSFRDVITRVDREMARLAEEMVGMRAATLELVRVAERQTATLEQLKAVSETVRDHDERIRKMEVTQPQLMESRSWVLLAAAVALSAVFQYVASRFTEFDKPPVYPPRTAIIDKREGQPALV